MHLAGLCHTLLESNRTWSTALEADQGACMIELWKHWVSVRQDPSSVVQLLAVALGQKHI
jgi:hypothetical protein